MDKRTFSKKPSKQNRKRKVVPLTDDGSEVGTRQDKNRPITFLPEIVISNRFTSTRRFVNNGGAVSGQMTIQDLLNQFLIATSTTVGYCYVRCVRIKKFRILSPVQTQGTSVTVSVQPYSVDAANNSFSAIPETYVDTSASIDIPAYISLKPSIETPLGSWHYNTTTNVNLMTLVAPQGSTMDISFEYILNIANNASVYTATLAAAVVGTLYARNILTNFVPITVNSI